MQKQYNLERVLRALLNHLKAKVTPLTSDTCLREHPEYPGMVALKDCLSDWNIDSEAYRFDKAAYNTTHLNLPFLAHLKDEEGRFIMVSNIANGNVTYTDEYKQNYTITENEFLCRSDGIILEVIKHDWSGEKKYQNSRLKYFFNSLIIPFLLLALLWVFTLGFLAQPFSWNYLAVCIAVLTGCSFSILLLIQSINSNNPIIQNLCVLTGKNDCNAILKSDAAKITAWLSWSEVGFFYFTGSLLLLLVAPAYRPLLTWLNLLSLPFIIYSIGFQYKSKNWCLLCCATMVVLVVEAIVNLYGGLFKITMSPVVFYLTPLCFVLPVTAWFGLRQVFQNSAQLKPIKHQLKKFKYNTELFTQALNRQPSYTVPDEIMPVVLGSTDAKTVVTMVTNPFCAPCAQTHQTLARWLKTHDDLQVKFIFSTANRDDEVKTIVARHIIALGQLDDKTIVKVALEDWYKKKGNYKDWIDKYPTAQNDALAMATKHQQIWCHMAQIKFTPTILVNGHKLPEPYSLEELEYFIRTG